MVNGVDDVADDGQGDGPVNVAKKPSKSRDNRKEAPSKRHKSRKNHPPGDHNDQAPQNAPPGAAKKDASHPDYCEKLFFALQGKAVSPKFSAAVNQRGQAVETLLGDEDAFDNASNDDLRGLLFETATILLSDIDESQAKPSSRLKRLGRALHILRPGETLKDQVVNDISEQIDTELTACKKAQGDNEKFADERLAYAKLARKLMGEGNHQLGFEFLESAQALGGIAKAAQKLDDVKLAREDTRQRTVEDNKTSQKSAEQDLSQEWKDTRDRLLAAKARVTSLDQFANSLKQNKGMTDAQKKSFDDLYQSASLAAFSLTMPEKDAKDHSELLPTKENRAALRGVQDRTGKLLALVDEAEKPLKDFLEKVHAQRIEDFGHLAKHSKHDLKHKGGDFDGGGDVASKRRARGVPKEILNQIGGRVDALKSFYEIGGLLGDTYDAMAEIDNEARQEIKKVTANLKTYQKISEKVGDLRDTLTKSKFQYLDDELDDFLQRIDDAEGLLSTKLSDLPAPGKPGANKLNDALNDLGEIEKDLKAKTKTFEAAEDEFKALEKRMDGLRTGKINGYSKLLHDLIKHYTDLDTESPVDPNAEVSRRFRDRIRGLRAYEGRYVDDLDMIRSSLVSGDPASRKDTGKRLDRLEKDLDKKSTTIRGLLTDIKAHLKAKKKDDPSKAEDALSERRIKRKVNTFIDDYNASGKEIHDRKSLNDEFDDLIEKITTSIDDGKKTIDPDYKPTLGNYKVMRDVLKKRTKTIAKSTEWRHLIDEAKDLKKTVEAFVKTYKKLEVPADAPDGKNKDVLRAATSLKQCIKSIEGFTQDMANFFDNRVKKHLDEFKQQRDSISKRRKDKEKKFPGDDELIKKAREVVSLIEKKGKNISGFAEQIGGALDKSEIEKLRADLIAAQGAAAEVAIREETVRALKRYRTFLESSPLTATYVANPFDQGTPVKVMVAALAKAESDLMELVKWR